MPEDAAIEAAEEVIDELYSRKGFDYWWDDIDDDIRDGIRESIADRIESVYNQE